MIKRVATSKLKTLATRFPVVVVTGPRQSGKTTLVTQAFKGYHYVSLEDLDLRAQAESDPRGFLGDHPSPAIFDEVQRAPGLLSYLQTRVDARKRNGQYILTGSQNILLQEGVSQSLAGRAAYLTLLPFSLGEMQGTPYEPATLDVCLFKGSYPRLHDQRIKPIDWFPNYLRTYVERDVRQVKDVTDLAAFQRFMRLAAGRIGQLLNLSSLANDAGINYHTAASWLSVLEASFITFTLRPHHANFNKRLIKAPKLYFHDTGLACSLAGITEASQLKGHFLRGPLFENLVVSELVKHAHQAGQDPAAYFWRDKLGNEIDCLVERPGKPLLIEVKSGQTPAEDYFKNLSYWGKVSGDAPADRAVIYGGDTNRTWGGTAVIAWKGLSSYLRVVLG